MHVTPSGRGPRIPSAAAARKDAQRLTEHVDRKLSQVGIPKAAPGGGIADIASVYTSGAVGILWPSGGSNLSYGSASYTAESVAGDTSWLSIAAGDIAVTEDGFYQAHCYVDLRWASQAVAPGASLALYLNGNPATNPGRAYYPIHQAATLWGVVQPISSGPEWLTAGQYWRLEADGGAPSSADVTRSSASWRIAKYG